jgi:sec-independent protein translocase protein TatA
MPFNIGFPELLLILAVALIVFGPRKLPEVGRSIGRAMGEFRRATHDLKSSLEEDIDAEAGRPTPKTPPPSSIPTKASSPDES